MSPVLVLTRGPRLIRTLTVLIGHEQAAFALLPNLLLDFVTPAGAAFEGALPEVCITVFGCFLSWLTAFRLDLEDTRLSFGNAGPLAADQRLVRMLPFTFLLTPNTRLVGCIED